MYTKCRSNSHCDATSSCTIKYTFTAIFDVPSFRNRWHFQIILKLYLNRLMNLYSYHSHFIVMYISISQFNTIYFICNDAKQQHDVVSMVFWLTYNCSKLFPIGANTFMHESYKHTHILSFFPFFLSIHITNIAPSCS